jgi:large subunit ribosomal protein L1
MAKKADLLAQAKELGLELTEKNTIAQIEEAIATQGKDSTDETTSEEPKLAKAGKRSAKAIAEVEEKAEKEARKESGEEPEAKVKRGPVPVTRPLIERRGKAYRKVAELVDSKKSYSLDEAIELATKTNPAKFDATVEIHTKLGVDPRQADQNIRSTLSLPNGSGKTVRVAVFAPDSEHAAAKEAGADVVGDETILQQLDKEELNFDVLVATPQFMPQLGKYARLLGPRGLMPNPKTGTVAADVAKATSEAKAGKVEYRVDKQAIVHLGIGKVSFGTKKLVENAEAFVESLKSQKPTTIKSTYVKSITITTTQGPAIKVENSIN